jgi:hypothetical protein
MKYDSSAWAIIAGLKQISPDVTFRTNGETLWVGAVVLTPALAQMLREHKQEIIDYLTMPPSMGVCGGCGEEIEWECSKFGLWLCSCLHRPDCRSRLKNSSQLPLPIETR